MSPGFKYKFFRQHQNTCRRYFKAAYYYLDEPHRIVPPATLPDWEDAPGPDGSGEGSGAVSVPDFAGHVSQLHADSDAGFAKEYSDIQKYCLKQIKFTFENSSLPDNKCKNRYLNIVACEYFFCNLKKLCNGFFLCMREKNRERDFI